MRKRLSCLLFTTILAAYTVTGCNNNNQSYSSSNNVSLEQASSDAEYPAFLKPGYMSAKPAVLTAAYTVNNETKIFYGDIFQSLSGDESALLVSDNSFLTLNDTVINKSGNSTAEFDNRSYGQNAALAVIGGSSAALTNTTITSTAHNSNAIACAGNRSLITAKDLSVTTIGDNSTGIDASYNGQITASNISVTTTGAYSAPISIGEDGGEITITKGNLSASHGVSPCIFSAGRIALDSVSGYSLNNAASIEGGFVSWDDCSFTCGGSYGILLYETSSSTSGSTTFTSNNSRLSTTASSSVFYATNTTAYINLTNTIIDSSCNVLLNCAGNTTENWGEKGENGAIVQLNADSQILNGSIICDSDSQISVSLRNNSNLVGAINTDKSGDLVSISLDSSSKWNVTDTSYIHILKNADSSCSNIISNGNTIYYDDSESSNRWLGGKTIQLKDGGTLKPMK